MAALDVFALDARVGLLDSQWDQLKPSSTQEMIDKRKCPCFDFETTDFNFEEGEKLGVDPARRDVKPRVTYYTFSPENTEPLHFALCIAGIILCFYSVYIADFNSIKTTYEILENVV